MCGIRRKKLRSGRRIAVKSFLIIGMGTFGHHLCRCLAEQGCEIMIVDQDEDCVSDLLHLPVSAKIGDCTDIEVLKSFGVQSFDACFVCIGDSFQDSLEITDLLRELGAKKIFSKADRDIQEKFLLRNGADEVIYPERDVARRVAVSESSDSIFDCIGLSGEYSIFELSAQERWLGKTIREVNFRARYGMSILAVKRDGAVKPLPSGDYAFNAEEHLLVLGRLEDVKKAVHD